MFPRYPNNRVLVSAPQPAQTPPQRRRRVRRGFTLIEAAMTTVIVGVGFVATLTLVNAGTMNNARGAESTTAISLARNIREFTLQKTFPQLIAYNGKSYAKAVDSREVPIDALSGWAQSVTVQPVDPNRITTDITDSSPSALRLTVVVTHNQKKLATVSWYAFDGTP
jgi:prepilin-type N-terminal cleavage/methylation domain-containing protein